MSFQSEPENPRSQLHLCSRVFSLLCRESGLVRRYPPVVALNCRFESVRKQFDAIALRQPRAVRVLVSASPWTSTRNSMLETGRLKKGLVFCFGVDALHRVACLAHQRKWTDKCEEASWTVIHNCRRIERPKVVAQTSNKPVIYLCLSMCACLCVLVELSR